MEPIQSRRGAIWLVAGDKGGPGKTTMAVMMAAALSASREVTLLDTDVTSDATSWLSTRKARWPKLSAIKGRQERESIGDIACQEAEQGRHVIVDVGGGDAELLRVAMSVAELLVMPIPPSQFDLFSCKRMAKRVAECRRWNPSLRALFFINKGEPNWMLRAVNEDALEVCRSFAPVIETARTVICRRIPYVKASADGLGILEQPGAEQAAEEFWQLMLELDPSLREGEDDVAVSH